MPQSLGVTGSLNEVLVCRRTCRAGVTLLQSLSAMADLVKFQPAGVPAGQKSTGRRAGTEGAFNCCQATMADCAVRIRLAGIRYLSIHKMLPPCFALTTPYVRTKATTGCNTSQLKGRHASESCPEVLARQCTSGTELVHPRMRMPSNATEEVQAHLVQFSAQPRSLAQPASAACAWLPASRQIQF